MFVPAFAILCFWATTTVAGNSRVSVGSISTRFEFGYAAEIENLAVRPNGNILFTEPSPKANVWEINPSVVNGSAHIVASFPNSTSALGVASIGNDVYAVTTGNVGAGFAGQVGSFSVNILSYAGGTAKVIKSISVAQGKLVNKITWLCPGSDVILVSDPERYVVLGVNVRTGTVKTLLQDAATMTAGSTFPIGVNGLQTVGKYLYYINSSKALFCRVRLAADGTAAGPYQVIANISSALQTPDDFAVLSTGQAFIAGSNEILYVQPNGAFSVIAGGEYKPDLAGATSAQFGNGNASNTLYVTTTGKMSPPANSTQSGNGKVLALEIRGLGHGY